MNLNVSGSKSNGCSRLALALAAAAILTMSPLAAQAQTTPPAAAPAAEAPAAAPADPDHVVARIDGQPLTEREVKIALDELGPSLAGMVEEQKREQVIGFLIDIKLAARAAEKEKLAEGPEFQSQLAFLRERALMQTFLDQSGKKAVTTEAVKQIYDETVKELKPEQEVRASHILVETEEEAKAIEERLKKGEDFAAIAKELSKDPGSGQEGGDLGFFTQDQMVPEFAETAFKLEPGKLSAPVKSQFGWHIIKVAEKREKPVPTLDQVKDQIEAYVSRRAQQEAVQKLREGAKIERVDQPKAPAPGAAVPSSAQ
ncbi:peptidylprolyl isomerase [Terrihabitans sp. B22-R8]|uniref:peptidylprolyl isomerase n=1 Tax=Terrihabitans sp. B22-R8 TaxID=3425128 RepID=UPI00403C8A95